MMREGCKMKPNEAQEEFEEVQMTIRKREEDVSLKLITLCCKFL